MTYELSRLAAGSYDALLYGTVVASLVWSGQTEGATWTVELLEEMLPIDMPVPFTEPEHTFDSLKEARHWLQGAGINHSVLPMRLGRLRSSPTGRSDRSVGSVRATVRTTLITR